MTQVSTQQSLCGRRYLVTGATSGIGQSAVQALRAAEAEVVAVGRNPGALAELAAAGCETHVLEL